MNYFGSFGASQSEALDALEPVLERALEAHRLGDYHGYMKLMSQALSEKNNRAGVSKSVS